MFCKVVAVFLTIFVVAVCLAVVISLVTAPKELPGSSTTGFAAASQGSEIGHDSLVEMNHTSPYDGMPSTNGTYRCHVYMNGPRNNDEGKICPPPLTPTIPGQTQLCKQLLNMTRKETTCCNITSVCNGEAYCGRGEMKCLGKNGRDKPICVCHRGWQGPRCDMCSPKAKITCSCHLEYPTDLSLSACSSNDADLSTDCWAQHRINDQTLKCYCSQEQTPIPDTRCSEDRTALCGDTEESNKVR